jgi:beta-lactamase class A
MEIKSFLHILVICLTLHICSSSGKAQVRDIQKANDSASLKIKDTLAATITPAIDHAITDSCMVNLLKEYPQFFDSILKYRKSWNVQIIYTEINRDRNNVPKFIDHYFNVDTSKYFYPASTVKLPTALLALQKLNELSATGITRNTSMITEAAYSGQSPIYNDPQTIDGRPSIESYIKRIFLVSDNEAFNRLYEFLGPQYINEQLHNKGFADAQIIHRLDIALSEDENRHTNPVKFLDGHNNILFNQLLAYNGTIYPDRNDLLGKAYYKAGELIDTPMNFSRKNRVSLEDLHHILRSVIFHDNVPAK